MKFHNDNAPAHTARRTKEFLKQSGLELIEHPTYSSDLAPCDFSLFPTLIRYLKRRRFESETELIATFLEAVDYIPQSCYSRLFNLWVERCQKCIDANGEYFEHLEYHLFI